LDIITNKATEEERQSVPHHLFNFLEPTKEYSVTEFVEDAIQKVILYNTIYIYHNTNFNIIIIIIIL